MSYDVLHKIVDDKEYISLKNQLKGLENKIYDATVSSENKIPYIKKAIKIAKEIYIHSINKEYSKFYIDKFGNNTDEYALNNLKNLLEFHTICSKYEKALKYEQNGNYNMALKIYYDILENHIPAGSSYYSTPISLLERINHFQEAIKICDLTIYNIKNYNLNFDASTFQNWKNKLNYEIKLSKKLILYIQNNSGILQKDIYRNFDIKYKYLIQQILYDMGKSNKIIRKKHGNSYNLYLK